MDSGRKKTLFEVVGVMGILFAMGLFIWYQARISDWLIMGKDGFGREHIQVPSWTKGLLGSSWPGFWWWALDRLVQVGIFVLGCWFLNLAATAEDRTR